MILVPNKINQNDLFDYTIIGAGILGILLALDLSESKKKISLKLLLKQIIEIPQKLIYNIIDKF